MHPRLLLALAVISTPTLARAASVPEHEAFAVLVVADEVNPNQLSDADLTQPEDFAPALQAPNSGLSISAVTTVDSQCADDALESLTSATPPDVVLYFAHRAATSCDGIAVQAELVTALRAGLEQSTGIVVLHHGLYPDLYQAGAKDSLLELVGGTFEGIAWDTAVGQRVFNVGGDHFVSTNGLTYEGNAAFAGVANVASGNYQYFDNIPDERYPNVTLLTQPDEQRTVLFASDTGGERVLGYVLLRPSWQRSVVVYQPGEYQPNALDARDGNNFQVLANALYVASRSAPNPVAPVPSATSESSASAAPNASSTSRASSSDMTSPIDTSNSADATTTTTAASATTSFPVTTGEGSSTNIGTNSSLTTSADVATTTNDPLPSTPPSVGMSMDEPGSPEAKSGGCGCRVTQGQNYELWSLWTLVALVGYVRRTRRYG